MKCKKNSFVWHSTVFAPCFDKITLFCACFCAFCLPFTVNNFCFYLNLWCILLMRRKNVDKCFAMSNTRFSLWNDIHDVICNLRCNLFSVSLFCFFLMTKFTVYTSVVVKFPYKAIYTTYFWDKQRICFFRLEYQLISNHTFFIFVYDCFDESN